MLNESLDEKIRKLKDKIADLKDYINSDFCIKCISIHKEIPILEQYLRDLENECDR